MHVMTQRRHATANAVAKASVSEAHLVPVRSA